MLVLTRKLGEQIVLPDSGVLVTVLGISENRVRLGVTAPAEQRVHRQEIWERIRGEEKNENPPPPRDGRVGTGPPLRRGGGATAAAPELNATSVDQRQLADRIRHWTGGRIRGLRVERDGDQLVVYGRSDSYYAWQLAQAAVAEFREVMPPGRPNPSITLDLEVVWPPPSVTSDNVSSTLES